MARTFAEIIAAYRPSFRQAPPQMAAAPARPEGGISLYNGQVRVQWGRDARRFTDHLTTARHLKQSIAGARGWDAASSSWLFPLAAAGQVVQAFSGFAVHPDLKAKLAAAPAPAPLAPAPTGKGRVELHRTGRIFVAWNPCSKDEWGSRVARCQQVKGTHGGTFSKPDGGWFFPLTAAGELAGLFSEFDIHPGVAALVQTKEEESGPCPLAAALLDQAEAVLVTY